MVVVGVDPGRSGGISLVCGETKAILETKPLPYRDKLLDVFALRAILAQWKFDLIVLEHVGVHFASSRLSSFSFGQSFGEIYAMLRLQTVPLKLVKPQAWQKLAFSPKTKGMPPKERARIAASNIWDLERFVVGKSKKPHDGCIDSALIGVYGAAIALGDVKPLKGR